MKLLTRAIAGGAAFLAVSALLVIGYQEAEPIIEAESGGVRAAGALATDYEPLPIELENELLPTESLAVERVRGLFEGEDCELRSVKCLRRMGADYCSICLSHPRNILAATLVRCRGDKCDGPVDGGEKERVGWNAEWACGHQFIDRNEWNAE